jgi:hypothetical protein
MLFFIFLWARDIFLIVLLGFFSIAVISGSYERILFALSLALLTWVIAALLFDRALVAEKLSVFVYYGLVLWVWASLLGPIVSRSIEKYIPRRDFPSWWGAYMKEIFLLISLMRQILPIVILGLFAWSASPWGYLVSFDIQFIGALAILFFFSSFVSLPDDILLDRWLVPGMVWASFCIVWWIFPVTLLTQFWLISLWIALLWIYFYRREYVKTIAQKLISL